MRYYVDGKEAWRVNDKVLCDEAVKMIDVVDKMVISLICDISNRLHLQI